MASLRPLVVCAALGSTIGVARTSVAGAPGSGVGQCPDFVRGSKLSVTDVEQGVAVKVVTQQRAFVAPLRALLREAAEALEQQSDAGKATLPAERTGAEIPPIDLDVEDVAGGALITVRADQRGDVDLVRHQARDVETFWETSSCVTAPSTL